MRNRERGKKRREKESRKDCGRQNAAGEERMEREK